LRYRFDKSPTSAEYLQVYRQILLNLRTKRSSEIGYRHFEDIDCELHWSIKDPFRVGNSLC